MREREGEGGRERERGRGREGDREREREGGRESSLNRQARPVCRAVSLLPHPAIPCPLHCQYWVIYSLGTELSALQLFR